MLIDFDRDVVLYRTARTQERALKEGGYWTPDVAYARRTHLDLPLWTALLPKGSLVFQLTGSLWEQAATEFPEVDAVMAKKGRFVECMVLRSNALRDVHVIDAMSKSPKGDVK